MRVVLEKCRPRLAARRGAFSSKPHVLLDRAFGDNDAEFEQFTANALSAPGAIHLGHVHDQFHRLSLELGLVLPLRRDFFHQTIRNISRCQRKIVSG